MGLTIMHVFCVWPFPGVMHTHAYMHSIPACQLVCGCIVRGEIESVTESGSLNGQHCTHSCPDCEGIGE